MTLNMYPSFILTLSFHVLTSREAAFYDMLTHSKFCLYFPTYTMLYAILNTMLRVGWTAIARLV